MRFNLAMSPLLAALVFLACTPTGGQPTQELGTNKILFSTSQDDYLDDVRDVRNNLKRDGFIEVSSFSELQGRVGRTTLAIALTPSSLPHADPDYLKRLFKQGVIFVGLDLTRSELEPLLANREAPLPAIGREAGRPILTLIYEKDACRRTMSDWLDSYDVAKLVDAEILRLSGPCP